MNRFNKEVISQSGSAPGFFFGPKLLWWKEEKKEVYDKTARFIEPSVYIAGKFAGLRGEEAFMDYTALEESEGFMDCQGYMAWDFMV